MIRKTFLMTSIAILMLIPAGVLAQTTNEYNTDYDLDGIILKDNTVGPVGIVDELNQAHSQISAIMINHSEQDYGIADELVFTLTYVDTETQELVVMLDPILLSLGLHYDAGDIEDILGTEELPIRVEYGIFIDESHVNASQSQIDGWISLYDGRCASPTDNGLCIALAGNLTSLHYTLDSNNRWQPPTAEPDPEPTPLEPTAPGTDIIFEDNFEDGLDNWDVVGNWEAKRSDEYRRYLPDWPADNKVAETEGRCSNPCTMELANSIDLTRYDSATLEFARFVDRSLDDDEFLKVELYDGTWSTIYEWSEDLGDNDDRWHQESYNLANYLDAADFKIRFAADPSSISEEAGIENLKITGNLKNDVGPIAPADSDGDGFADDVDNCPQQAGLAELNGCPDTEAPVINVPEDITETQRSSLGKYIEFSVTATDNVDSMVIPTCDHGNDWYAEGTTIVTCTATDMAGNEASETFTITVNGSTPVIPDTDGDGFHDGIDNCPDVASSTNNGCPEEPVIPEPPVDPTDHVFFGGEKMTMVQIASTNPKPDFGNATITIGATKVSGQVGFVTAGHSVIPKPFPIMLDGFTIGNDLLPLATLSVEAQNIGNGDFAFVPLTETNISVSQSQIKALDGTLIDVVQGSTEHLGISPVQLYGINTNSQGSILYKNVTSTSGGQVTTNMVIANYESVRGDSGAPIISVENGVNSLIGIHKGATCHIDVGNLEFHYLDHQTLCAERHIDGGINYFKLFTPWETVKDELQLQ